MTARRSTLLAPVLAVVLVLAAAACTDDGGDATDDTTTTTEAATPPVDDDPTATTEAGDTGAGDTEPADTTTTADPDVTTTSPNLAPNDSPLVELLLPPSAVGDGYAPDDTLGDGGFDGDLCEEVTVEATFDDQASQALLRGTGDDAVSFTQSIMRFGDEAAAEALVDALVEGIPQCSEQAEVTDVDLGDQAAVVTEQDEEVSVVAGIVRVGDLVSFTIAFSAAGIDTPLDDALLAATEERLRA